MSISAVPVQWGPPVPDLDAGGRRLEQELQLLAEQVRDACGDRLSSLVVAGSIGRAHAAGLRPSQVLPEDYDLIAVLDTDKVSTLGLQRRIDRRLAGLGGRVGPPVSLGLLRTSDLQELPFTLFNYELRYGSRVLWGEDPSGKMPGYDATQMPLIEASRLLLNRGVRLWGDAIRVRQSAPRYPEAEKIALRNRKAIMALGDALLIATGRFHWAYRRRLEQAAGCQLFDQFQSFDLRQRYVGATEAKLNGVQLKLDDDELSLETLNIFALHQQVLRHVEESRLQREIRDWSLYATSELKYPAYLRPGRIKQLTRLLLRFGPPQGYGFYQRHWKRNVEEVLMMAFPYLAYGTASPEFVGGALNWRAQGEPDAFAVWRRFRRLWREAR